MRLLLDEWIPRRLGRSIPNHTVQTVVDMGWGGMKNGELLSLAAPKFDAFITVDKNVQFQQNLSSLPIAVVVLHAQSNELQILMPLMRELEETLASLEPRLLVNIGA